MPNTNPVVTIERIIGNTEAIGVTILDNDGDPIDLTGKTLTGKFFKTADDAQYSVDMTVNAVSATDGTASVVVASTHVDVAQELALYVITDDSPAQDFPYDGARLKVNVKARGTQ